MKSIQAGSLVRWKHPNVSLVFCESTAVLFAEKPLVGMLSRIDGEIGRLSYMKETGKKGEISVLLTELTPMGVPHAE